MADLGLEDARQLAGWQPELGVISLYLRFEPGDRGERWRTELHNGLDRVVGAAAATGHARKMAIRSTAKRLVDRFNNGAVRPPPRGEAGFVEVSEEPGRERWWPTGVAPDLQAVTLADQPLLAPFIGLLPRSREVAVVLLSAERVRLLCFCAGSLEELDGWELDVSGHDWRPEQLAHNRRRFLAECGHLVGERLRRDGLDELLAFGPRPDFEAFRGHLDPGRADACFGGEDDLISVPAGDLVERVSRAVDRLAAERDRALAERALAEAHAGGRGAAGMEETLQALGEGRVERLVFDPAIGEPAEALVRTAFAGDTGVTVVHDDDVAELLAPARGVAAILRY